MSAAVIQGRKWVRAVVAVVVVSALLLALLWIFQRRLIYLPDRSPVPSAAAVLAGGTDVDLHTDDGLTLHAWYLPAAGPPAVCPATWLVAPGNGGNRLGRVNLARALGAGGAGVMLMDYRGYGGNPGSPDEAGVVSDARAAYRFLTQEAGVAPGQIVYFGESLGAAVVVQLAVEHPPAALVLRSPFTDLPAAARVHYPFLPTGLLLRDRFRVADLARLIAVPTTVIYGTADTVIPPEQSVEVAASSGGDLDIVAIDGVDHNDPTLVAGPEVVDAAWRAAARVTCPPAR